MNLFVKSRTSQLLLVLSAALAVTACTQKQDSAEPDLSIWPHTNSPVKNSATQQAIVDALLAKMTQEEKVGQILQAEIQAITPQEVAQYNIGSVLNGGGSIPGNKENATPADWLQAVDAFYLASIDKSDGGVGVPIIWGTDAVHGHNNLMGATLFPHNIGLGAANNPELIREIGRVTAAEVRATGIDWVFAPTVAVAQNDRWGRTYESYSEDPALVKRYAAAMVEGLQGAPNTDAFLDQHHVVATAKHFLGDGATTGGDDQGNAQISERELASVHAAGYTSAIEEGVQTVMASYSSWQGDKLHGHQYLLTDILKERMGFDGLVIGDMNGHAQVPGCTNESCPQAINAGVDLVMVPADWKNMYHNVLAQVASGEIPMARLDQAVRNILNVKARLGLFSADRPSQRAARLKSQPGSDEHRAIARQAVRESLVLLKNNGALLPLSPQQHILVAGPGADDIGMQSGGWSISWQGVTNANQRFPGATSIYQGIARQVVAAGGRAELSVSGEYAETPDVAMVVFGEKPYAEGLGDLNTLEFEAGNKKSLALLKRLKQQGIPTVAVFISGRPLWVNPELNAADAFVAAWLPGTEGEGVADVLLRNKEGNIQHDFTGRLSFSWPATPLQAVLNPHHPDYYPLFKLGYGLDYSQTTQLAMLNEHVAGVDDGQPKDIDLYVGRLLQPWYMFISEGGYRQILSGSYARLTNGTVTLKTIIKDGWDDALEWQWQGQPATLSIEVEAGPGMDLSTYVESGTIIFDVKVDEMPEGKIEMMMQCGKGCSRRLDISSHLHTLVARGWQNISVKLSCFAKNGADLSAVTMPFGIEASGRGTLSLANIQILRSGDETLGCE